MMGVIMTNWLIYLLMIHNYINFSITHYTVQCGKKTVKVLGRGEATPLAWLH